jgi:hypothetical protein
MGVAGMIIDSLDHARKFPAFSTSKVLFPSFFLMAAMTPFGESTRPGQRRSAVPSASCPAETTAP